MRCHAARPPGPTGYVRLRLRRNRTISRPVDPSAASNPGARYAAHPFVVHFCDPQTKARCGCLKTLHGDVETPAFMPVGTQGTVKGMMPRDLWDLGARIVLANAYHLCLRPGAETITELGGIHRFMGWGGAVLTDSGGYQILSLASLRKVSDAGVEFRSHLDGAKIFLTPEMVIDAQNRMGVDVLMPLDECPPAEASRRIAEAAARRTVEWALRSRARPLPSGRLLFGIVQGGLFPDLRRLHATRLAECDFAGYAVGGLSVGEERGVTREVAAGVVECLPPDRPRYLMGVGLPEDLLRFVAMGYDLFDCVLPTRNARNGMLFTRHGRMNIRLARYARDPLPPDPDCGCYVCTTFSRGYLRHLAIAEEMLAAQLSTMHNLYFYLSLMAEARNHIAAGDFHPWAAARIEAMEGEVKE